MGLNIKLDNKVTRQTIIDKIILLEGGYSNRACDAGGETNHGITKTLARAHGYTGLMRELSVEKARVIYTVVFWDKLWGNEILSLSPLIAKEVFEFGVNAGVPRAIRFLQRVLNVMNKQKELYQDITIDGICGPNTIKALKCYVQSRSDKIFVRALNCLQGHYYIQLTEARSFDEHNIYGWLSLRVSL